MTQEEKLKEAKRLYKTANADQKYVLERLFPELKEGENTDIITEIKNIITYFYGSTNLFVHHHTKEELLAWLEAQGEQKPVFEMKTPEESLGVDSDTYNKIIDECVYGEQNPTWGEEDEKLVKNLISTLSNLYARNLIEKETKEKYTNLLKSLKDRVQPKQEWSKEDEAMIDYLLQLIQNSHKEPCTKGLIAFGAEAWLKSLKPQTTWKPSDEQIMVLAKASETYCGIDKGVLYSLYNDLKKLREE